MDWDDELIGPTHILGMDYEILRVYIGIVKDLESGACVLWVSDQNYKKINHHNQYVLFHSMADSFRLGDMPHAVMEMIEETYNQKCSDPGSLDREHLHVFAPFTE